MKTIRVKEMLSLFFLLTGLTVFGQDQAEVPGDHFSLEGALELFKKSASPEEFERLLNSQSAKVNNLDLNDDGDIDYIKVIDRNEGAVHAFILQAVVSPTESQDVAVIELEKLANGKAVLQITGDADIYGTETIIEPTEEVRINAGTSTSRNVVNVWNWPSVQYVYDPYYSAWMSPWGWNARPVWWSSWRPVSYYVYSPWWSSYRSYYSPCYTHRVVYAQPMYRPYRSTSLVVYNRHHDQITHYRSSQRYTDYNRGRDDDWRMRNGQDNWSSHNSNNNGRQHASTGRDDNHQSTGRSSTHDWNNQGNDNNRGRSSSQNDSFHRNRSTDFNNGSSGSQNHVRSLSDQNSRNWSNRENSNTGSHQREFRSSFDSQGSQRSSTIQPDRSRSSGGHAINGSGIRGDWNKSGGEKKGRH